MRHLADDRPFSPGSARSTIRQPRSGFTLIEMMAVMVIIGLMSVVVLPSFQRWFDGLDSRIQSTELAARLQRLVARAALLGQTIDVTQANVGDKLADGRVALTLPEGWQIADKETLRINASGVCAGGRLKFDTPRGSIVLKVDAGGCEVLVVRGES